MTRSTELGKTRWAIAEGQIPARSNGPEPEMESHESACLLNVGERDAHSRQAENALVSTIAYAGD